MEHFLELETLLRMSAELGLGICFKLYCDNGRIHYRDFMNDFLFWVPGVESFDGTGLERQVAEAYPAPVATPVPEVEETPVPLAA